MQHVVFRADAAKFIGSGHVMRSLTLANKLLANGVKTTFITREHAGHLIERIEKNGHQVIVLPQALVPLQKNDEKSWLGTSQDNSTSQAIDATQCIEALNKISSIDWLIVDHYAIDQQWQNLLRPYVKKIMVIDDLANRKYECDVLLDQTLNRQCIDYQTLTPEDSMLLLGQPYMLLRDEFFQHKPAAVNNRKNINSHDLPTNILVTMGGSDPDNLTLVAVDALLLAKKQQSALSATIVMSSRSMHLPVISAIIAKHDWLTLIEDCDNMAMQMVDADIAIGASGSTAWERCCLGLPCLTLVTADNQKVIAKNLTKAGAIISLEQHEKVNEQHILEKLILLMNDIELYQAMVKQCFAHCDGRGVERVMSQVFSE